MMEHDVGHGGAGARGAVRGMETGAVEPVIGHCGPAAGCKWE